ncbi:hypothetical protein DEI95_12660 [Curtobacterium sp. MCBD17_008]|nr:hypothetical protein DEI95_12660 [Curtobacterium sp. MCBD17_008]
MRELGFLSFVPNHGGTPGAASALEDGLRLFEAGEALGYGTGWVRGRHFEPFLTSPMTFFAAAAQRTSTIGFGTAVLGMRYEDPVRLAEDASTVDLLSGGRCNSASAPGSPATARSSTPCSAPPSARSATRPRPVPPACSRSCAVTLSVPPDRATSPSPPAPKSPCSRRAPTCSTGSGGAAAAWAPR